MERVRIAEAGKHLPPCVLNNEEALRTLAENGVTETSSHKPLTEEIIFKTIGIKERRRMAADQNISDMGRLAAEDTLRKAGLDWDDIDILCVGTSTPETAFPSTACTILEKVGGPNIEAFDILAACTSAIYGMNVVKSRLLDEKKYRYGLVIGADAIGSRLASTTTINWDIWGDGAGCVLLEKIDTNEETGIICSIAKSIPEMAQMAVSRRLGTHTWSDDVLMDAWMEGTKIHEFVLSEIPNLILETIIKANEPGWTQQFQHVIRLSDVGLILPHQANGRIRKPIARSLGIPEEKIFMNVEFYGNTSSASIPIALSEAKDSGAITVGDYGIMVGFGAGLTLSAILFRL
ncbi:TPA: ketoacyl-ACP synthase III [Candidatus Berkelbacteria bacterium]|uniref:3-oxoacyl-(Acyl carrier protein) synthase III, 3-oxoacyl-[acyl-carrier-protein] synthase III n=1 Tax=Berkelbacteria bacterium GW2011_GWE1_39_12 TaxID=1618337 RepID=A0A0G4B4I0_9BACT|nr:MAG: 3-oxoacyl-(acyl carrier protein) synthase III, 3-oxoacyl-[acyl-carrier-protein] synthase III [Berkelbacteria bacterium GW2011_GWE1_39_12]HBO60899.1 ketoacyl-ACP synthase III [Candidatus Berkelbacteria bacterium]